MSRPRLQIIVASTRQDRKGLAVATWVERLAIEHAEFDVELVDLAAVGLPLFDEPNHPRLGQYVHQHTKDWSATVSRADAFILVTPEYNHSFPGSLKNALDYLSQEWADKPVGLVYVCATLGDDVEATEHRFGDGGRDNIREWSVTSALHHVRRLLQRVPSRA